MKKWVCPVCGYVHEGDTPPEECPVCHVPGSQFTLQAEEKTWAAEHVVGVGKVFGADVPEEVQKEIIAGLRANFEGECCEVGMYLAMARVAHREGYPEIGVYWEKAGLEEAEHAAKFAELLGEVVWDTKTNLAKRMEAESGACEGKLMIAKRAKQLGYDAIHDLEIAAAGNKFFDRLTKAGKLAKTILYCLNPKDNEVMMTMAYTFNDGTCPGKMQFGSGWWFLDQEVGMRRHIALHQHRTHNNLTSGITACCYV